MLGKAQVHYARVIAGFYLLALVLAFAFDWVIGLSRLLFRALGLKVNLGTAVGFGPGREIDTEHLPSSDPEACTSAFASAYLEFDRNIEDILDIAASLAPAAS